MPTPAQLILRTPLWCRCVVAAGGLFLSGAFALGAPADGPVVSKEYQIKASFLYNFTKFVEWPPTRFAESASPIIIGVIGRNPFGVELEKIVHGREVNGRPIVVRAVVTADDARGVHLLFVPVGEERGFELASATLRHVGVVTVGESESYAAMGGMITFMLEGDKVRFEIDIDAIEREGLKLSAQLQKLAKTVRRRP